MLFIPALNGVTIVEDGVPARVIRKGPGKKDYTFILPEEGEDRVLAENGDLVAAISREVKKVRFDVFFVNGRQLHPLDKSLYPSFIKDVRKILLSDFESLWEYALKKGDDFYEEPGKASRFDTKSACLEYSRTEGLSRKGYKAERVLKDEVLGATFDA